MSKSYSAAQSADSKRNNVVVKVGIVGDAAIGKTSFMVKYVEGTFDEDYIQTLGKFIYLLSDDYIAPPECMTVYCHVHMKGDCYEI